jgi:hypothetical protein
VTHEQTERLLDTLDKIETALAVMADYSEKLALMFEAAMDTNDNDKNTLRVADVEAHNDRHTI